MRLCRARMTRPFGVQYRKPVIYLPAETAAMKFLLILILSFALNGCLLELLTTTAIQGELAAENAESAMSVLEHARGLSSEATIQQAVNTYAAEKGHYPASLAVLVPDYLASVPRQPDGSAYLYDPEMGQLGGRASTQRSVSFTAADRENLKAISDAIYVYWESTGFYPPDLDALSPLYIKKVPKLSSGGKFIYEIDTGSVYHPSQLATLQQRPNKRNSNPATAGSPVGNIADQHSDRQMKALRELGLQ